MHLRPLIPLLAALLGTGLKGQAPPPVLAVPAPLPPAPAPPTLAGFALTGTAVAGSQYVFRGLTQTDGKPTLQGEVDFAHPSGWYLSLAFSNISWFTDQNAGFASDPTSLGSPGRVGGPLYDPQKVNSAGLELDLFGGYKWGFAKDWTLDLGAYRYLYPGNYENLGAFRNPDTTEGYLGLSYAWASLKYSRVLSANSFGVAHAQGTSYLDLSLSIPVGESGWTVLLHGGRTSYPAQANPDYFFNGTVVTGNNALFSYSDVKVGVSKEIKGYTFALAGSYANTKGRAADNDVTVYENAMGRNIGKGRAILTVTKAF